AAALDVPERNVKPPHHRARKAMAAYHAARVIPTKPAQDASRAALFEFMRRLEANDVAGVEALLADDAKTTTDGGGEFRSALRTIEGRDKVARFYLAGANIGQGKTARLLMLYRLPAVVHDTETGPPPLAPTSTMQLAL